MRSPKAVRRPKCNRAIRSRINAQGKRWAAHRNSIRNWINSTITTDPRYPVNKAHVVYHDSNQIEDEIARKNVQPVKSENDDKRRIELAKKEQEKEQKRREEQKRKQEEKKQRAAEEAKRQAEEQRRREENEAREAEERRKKEEENQKKLAEEKAKKESEKAEKAKKEAEQKAKKEAEQKAKKEAEKAKKEAEEKAKMEAEEKAKKEAEKKAKKEAEKKAKEEAEKKAKQEAEEKAKKEAEKKRQEEAQKASVEEVIEKTEVHSQQSAKQNGHQDHHQSKQSKKQQKKNKRNANSISEDQHNGQNGKELSQELMLDMSTVGSAHDAPPTKCSVDSGVDVTDFQTGKKGKKGNKSTSDVSLSSNKSSSDESISGKPNATTPDELTQSKVLGEQLIEQVVINGASALPLDKEGTPTKFAQTVAEFVTHAHQIIQLQAESQPLKHVKIEPIVPLVLPPKIERRPPRERVYKLLPQDIEYCSYMMETYGEDYEAMVNDKKNVYMDSPTHLKRKIRIFRDSPQYELYLKAKAEGKPISSIC